MELLINKLVKKVKKGCLTAAFFFLGIQVLPDFYVMGY